MLSWWHLTSFPLDASAAGYSNSSSKITQTFFSCGTFVKLSASLIECYLILICLAACYLVKPSLEYSYV